MAKAKKGKKRKKKNFSLLYKIVSFLLIIISVFTGAVLIYFEILPIVYLILALLVIAFFDLLFILILAKSRLRLWVKTLFMLLCLVYMFVLIFISSYAMGTLDFLNSIIDTGYRSETYSVYVVDGTYSKIEELDDKRIALYNLDDDAGKKAIDKVSSKISFNAVEVEDIQDSLQDVYDGKIDAVLMSQAYMDVLNEETDKYADLVSIYTFDILTKTKVISSDKDISEEPFIIYISGIDTSGKISEKARSDVNILVAVNPNTGKILMLNTPRDYYVKLHTKKKLDKLTHAGIYGIEESLMTLEDLYGVDISYYFRVNFTSFVTIVNKLGGIDVDVPVSFCEQNSKRSYSNQICLKKGVQELNGEEALALARTRHTLSGGDRSRIENQLLVLNAIFDKATSPSIIVKYNSLISALGDYVSTNMSSDEIIKFVKKQIKDPTDWDIKQKTVTGEDSRNTAYSTGSARVYVMEPDMDSVNEAKLALKEILEG